MTLQKDIEDLEKILDKELFTQLGGKDASSIQEESDKEYINRIYYLSNIVWHLHGSYNEGGIRQWFWRKRSALEGKAPPDILYGEWNPESDEAMKVLGLAQSTKDGT